MGKILEDLHSIKPINSATVAALTTISNENFTKISTAMYDFLKKISYDEDANKMTLSEIDSAVITARGRIRLIVNSAEVFSVDANGKLRVNSIYSSDLIETAKFRMTQTSSVASTGIGGEIIYGQVYLDQAHTQQSHLDFWGYVSNAGWFSLTQGGSGSGFVPASNAMWIGNVLEILSAPPTPPVSYGKYLVDWATSATGLFTGHEGEIAQYNFLTDAWSFVTATSGSAITDDSFYHKIYVKDYGNTTSWTTALGYSGISGVSGWSGHSGYSGQAGSAGASGYSGLNGASGYSGTNGSSGYSGASGGTGYSGWSGYSGPRGYSGTSGATGLQGSGWSGVSGYSGILGTSGYSGSGVSGYSGSGVSGYSGTRFIPITTTTTDDVATDIYDIAIPDNSLTIIKAYVSAYNAEPICGGWERTIYVTRISGVTSILKTISDSNAETSGLDASSVSFDVNGNNQLRVRVTGISDKTIAWRLKYEII